VLVLALVSKELKKFSMGEYDLDTAHFLTSLGFALQVNVKKDWNQAGAHHRCRTIHVYWEWNKRWIDNRWETLCQSQP